MIIVGLIIAILLWYIHKDLEEISFRLIEQEKYYFEKRHNQR